MTVRMLVLAGLVPALMALGGCQGVQRFASNTPNSQRAAAVDEFLGLQYENSKARNQEIDTVLYGKR